MSIAISDGTNTVNTTASVNTNAYSVTGLDLSTLDDGTLSIRADVNDLDGNSATQASDTTSKDSTPPTISVAINDGGDGRLNTAEVGSVAIAGTTSGAEDGQTVAINISSAAGGTPINTTATVTSNSYSVTGLDLSSLADGTLSITADVSDLAGNPATQASDTTSKDTAAPSIAISSDLFSLAAGETTTLTFSLSESSSNFTAADIAISGGSLSGFSGSNSFYTATFTPSSESTANGIISVANGTFSDFAGNTNTDDLDPDNSLILSIDTIGPSIALTSELTSLKAGETASLTFTLSESSSNFTAADINISGGSLSAFSGSGSSYSAIFTPDLGSNADGVISVDSSSFSDLAGNPNSDGSDLDNTLILSIDTLAPSIALTSDITSLNAGDVANLSFSLSEPSTDFDASDISISGGSLSAFSGSGSSYTAIFTPTADSATDALISVANSKFTDAFGNSNVDGADSNNSLTLSIDTVIPPTLILTSNITTLTTGDVAKLSFSLSEPSTDFTASDITVSGGSLSDFSGSGTSYTATFTPNANSTSDGLISVASSTFSDLAGNPNTDGADLDNSLTLTIDTATADTKPPTIVLSSHTTSLSAGEAASITFSLSEPSADFVESDLSISGGTLSGFSGSGSSYSATFTPNTNSTTDGLISVSSSAFSDAAGNLNADGSDPDNSLSLTIDTLPPSISLSSDTSSLSTGETASIAFSLSEPSTDFNASDISVSGGSLSGFSGSGSSYSATFTPNADSIDAGLISVTNSKFSDAFGNFNTDNSDPDNSLTLTIDTLPPSISLSSDTSSLTAGETASITFSLSEPSADFSASDISVSGGSLSAFSGSGASYSAIFTPNPDSIDPGLISVTNSKFSDAFGNFNIDDSDPDNSLAIAVDTTITNTPPQAAADLDFALEDISISSFAPGILFNDSDADGPSPLSVTHVKPGSASSPGSPALTPNTITGSYGTLSLNNDGSYTYSADQDAAESLGSGELATDTFTYTISDGTDNATAELIITITGINDAPVIFDATTRRKYIEGSGQSTVIDTSLSGIDADHLTISSASVVISSGYLPSEDLLSIADDAGGLITASWNPTSGTLTLTGTTSAENYERALESVAYENTNLINPSTTERTIAWSVNDGIANSNAAITIIDVGGTNDAPIATDDVAALLANTSISTSAATGLLSNDSDLEADPLTITAIRTGREYDSNGTTGSIAAPLTGSYGSLTLNADGSYTYSTDQNAVISLGLGDFATDAFTYTLSDGTDTDLAQLSITVTGTNDPPIANDDTVDVAENSSISKNAASGLILANDIDPDGDPLVITDISIASPDGNQNRTSTEASTTGIDSTSLTSIYGTLTLNADGSYSYAADQQTCDALDPGDIAIDRFYYTLSDGSSTADAQLSIAVYGRNDAPHFDQQVIQATITERPGSSATTSSNLSGTFSASDPDADSLLSYTAATVSDNPSARSRTNTTNSQTNTNNDTTTVGSYGSLSLNPTTGDYSYTPHVTAIEALNDGDTALDLFRISASDGTESSTTDFSVRITGADENPTPSPTPAPTPSPTPDSNPDPTPAPNPDPTPPPNPSPTPDSNPDPTPPPNPDPTPESPLLQEPIELDCLISSSKTNSGLKITGSPCNDIIKGQTKDDVLLGRSGDDLLKGKSGNDLLKGGKKSDLLRGGRGDDTLRGGQDNDTLRGGQGADHLIGHQGQDRLIGRQANDVIRGRSGDDTIKGGQGDDNIRGGQGADHLIGHQGNDLLIGRPGNDVIRGRSGDDTIKGGQGDDTIKAGRGADLIHLSRGQDQIFDFKPRRGDRLIGNDEFSFAATELDGHLILTDIDNNTHITLRNISLNTVLAVQPELFS